MHWLLKLMAGSLHYIVYLPIPIERGVLNTSWDFQMTALF